MITLDNKAIIDNKIMSIMKVNTLSHLVAQTDKGHLTLTLPKGGSKYDYRFVLDSVPYNDEDNEALIDLFKGVLYN